MNVPAERLESIKNEKFHLEPKKEVKPIDTGRLADYLRFEEGIVNAIDNIKVYIKRINHEHIQKTDLEANKLINDYILKNSRLKEFQDQTFTLSESREIYSQIGSEALREKVESLSALYKSYGATIDKLIEQHRASKNAVSDFETKNSNDKLERKILDQINSKRRNDLKTANEVNKVEVSRNIVTQEVSIEDAQSVTDNFDFSQKKFNKKFFELLLLRKKEEIENAFKTTESIKQFLKVESVNKALETTELLKVSKETDQALKEQIDLQTLKTYTQTAQYLKFNMNTPLLNLTI